MKAQKGLNIAGLVLGIVSTVTSITGLILSIFAFLGRKKNTEE